jgi:plastocyanin
MRGSKRRIALVGALALVSGLLFATTPAQAQGELKIQVAQPFGLGGASCNPTTFQGCQRFGEGMRFYTPTLNVHKGDVLTFDFKSFHTATLLPANEDVFVWRAANAGGVGKPYSLVTSDPDDSELDGGSNPDKPALKANNQAVFPTNPLCGSSAAAACTYDGSAVFNGGLHFGSDDPANPDTFSVEVDANVGERFWVICLVHTHMFFRVNVVDNATPATTQAAIDTFRDSTGAADTEEAVALDSRLINRQSKHTTADGKVVWDAFMGFDKHFLSLDAMYPKKLVIRRGQTVRWHAVDVYEDHTVTLPRAPALEVLGRTFVPGCDPDGDAGAGPDNPPELEAPPFCLNPAQVELDIPADAANQFGDGRFNGDYQNSGIRGAQSSTAPYDLKFTKTTSKKGVKYICLIHGPFMRGRVRVRT